MVEQSINLLEAYGLAYTSFPWLEQRIIDLQIIQDQLEIVFTRALGAGDEAARNAAEQELRRLVSLESWLIGNGQQNTTLPKISAAIQLGVPAAQRAGLKWLSGYLSVGTAIIFYHLIIGIGSAVMIRASADLVDPTWFSIFLGYVAPVMALGLATGGGVALWNGLQSGVSPLFRL